MMRVKTPRATMRRRRTIWKRWKPIKRPTQISPPRQTQPHTLHQNSKLHAMRMTDWGLTDIRHAFSYTLLMNRGFWWKQSHTASRYGHGHLQCYASMFTYSIPSSSALALRHRLRTGNKCIETNQNIHLFVFNCFILLSLSSIIYKYVVHCCLIIIIIIIIWSTYVLCSNNDLVAYTKSSK